MKQQKPYTDWNSIQTKVGQVLGEDFWQDMSEMIPVFGPRIDVYELPQEVLVFVELPGLPSTEGIKITMNGSVLTITGAIESPYEHLEKEVHVSERFIGPFTRKINLPNVLYKSSKAKYQNGLLVITLTKSDYVQEQQIKIE